MLTTTTIAVSRTGKKATRERLPTKDGDKTNDRERRHLDEKKSRGISRENIQNTCLRIYFRPLSLIFGYLDPKRRGKWNLWWLMEVAMHFLRDRLINWRGGNIFPHFYDYFLCNLQDPTALQYKKWTKERYFMCF